MIKKNSKIMNGNNITKLPSDKGDFIKISVRGTDRYLYGGDQSFFSDENYRKNGCGTIAMANLLIYISSAVPDFFKKPPEYCGNSIDEYMALADDINKYLPPDADGIKLTRVFKSYTGNALEYFPLFFNSKEKIYRLVKKSLSADIPVIISVYNPLSFPIYEYAGGRFGKEHTVKAHYMTAVQLSENNSHPHSRTVILSNWGKKFVMDLDDFYEHNKGILFNGFGRGIGSGIFVPHS